jgi:enoyl-CoA hydratase/carnithine racemase
MAGPALDFPDPDAPPAGALPTDLVEIDPAAGLRLDLGTEVATIWLNRPERLNCQTPRTWEELSRLRRALPARVRVVVLRGEGRAFSAGLDRDLLTGAGGVLGLAAAEPGDAAERMRGWQQAFDWSSRPDLVSVAAVQGHAVGAGLQLALGADIRILAEDAQLALPEAGLGLVPDLGGTHRLVDLVGYSAAAELCLTGRTVAAAEAVRLGLAGRAVPAAELDAAVEQVVAGILAVDRDASAETKALLLGAGRRSRDEQEAAERDAQYRRLRALAGLDRED